MTARRKVACAAIALSLLASHAVAGNRTVSIYLRDADIRKTLTQFAELLGRNIVFTEDVYGKITIELNDVPLEQAFQLILRQKQLYREDHGDIMIIKPIGAFQ